VLKACLDYLRIAGIAAWRINQAGTPLHDGSGGFRPGPSRGVADIIGIVQRPCGELLVTGVIVGGLFPKCGCSFPTPIAIEAKAPAGRQSQHQRQFQSDWEGAGGLYLLVRSADELRAKLREARVAAP
jgi:hypothetical protein